MNELAAVICSPPYSGTHVADGEAAALMAAGLGHTIPDGATDRGLRYGRTAGQLGGMAVGDLAAILTSPPYAESVHEGQGGTGVTSKNDRRNKDWQGWQKEHATALEGYGTSAGQLGALKPGIPPGEVTMECEELDWPMSVCYGQGWGDLICPEAFAHPAKMARGLLTHILDFCLERGFLTPGSLVADPFGGVGTTGLLSAYRGLRAVSVELEPRFVDLAQKNYDLHRRELEILGCPLPVIVRGDSRAFARIVGEAGGIVTSPPYAGIGEMDLTPAKIERMKANEANGQSTRRQNNSRKAIEKQKALAQPTYGTSPGQLGAMPPGDVAAVLTSPPYEGEQVHGRPSKRDAEIFAGRTIGEHGFAEYGREPGNIGNDRGDTYWAAVRDIYAQCLLALRPGGWLVCVVKSYVSKRKIVDLPAQTAALLTHLGFDLRILARAWLVERKEHAGLFGQTVVEEKSRESFFRRLAVKKGSPRIPFETVLFARKPEGGQGGGIDAAVTSPPYADAIKNGDDGIDWNKVKGEEGAGNRSLGRGAIADGYGHSPGQLGALPAGSLDDVIGGAP